MGWGKEWPLSDIVAKDLENIFIGVEGANLVGLDLSSGDSQTVLTTWEDGNIKHHIIPSEELYKNLKPTHDPYTNPNSNLYYECGCGAILDPGTKSFAQLNNCASEKGWKVRFSDKGYVPYCVKCGENVE